MTISLHIERLVLDGLPLTSLQGRALQVALEAELGRLLGEHGLENFRGGAVPHLSVAPIQLSAGAPPSRWGREIARTLCSGLVPRQRIQNESSQSKQKQNQRR